MRLPKSVMDNLHFLLAETTSQVSNLQVVLETASQSVAQRILDRQGYCYNLKMRVHDGCSETLRKGKKGDVNIFSLRSAEIIASNMERISDLCQECVALMGNLTCPDALKERKTSTFIKDIIRGISLIEQALHKDDTRLALKLGNIERKLDRAYEDLFQTHLKDLQKKKKNPQDIITSLFVAHRIEEMGDVLLVCSESIMSAKLGQPMHIDRFKSLKTALHDLGLIDAEVNTIAETKSGSAISGISDTDGYVAIFKDGKKEKLKEERESVESWHEIFPGLAPQIISYEKQGKNASLLIEHLPGQTFENLLLQADDATLQNGLDQLCHTLKAVWKETKRKRSKAANHMGQLEKRLNAVFEVHPGFNIQSQKIGTAHQASLNQLIETAGKLEEKVDAPFSVYIHGDFNLDNIIYDDESNKIRFIDLHRSCYQDYTQDISVFMVSNYRLQVLDQQTRRRIRHNALTIYDFARDFAQKNKDKTFDLRLAFGLARSFISSTRFILDQELAKAMFLRGVYILECLSRLEDDDLAKFSLPVKELFS